MADDATTAAARSDHRDRPARSSSYVALAVICFAIFVAALDQTAVSALLPDIVIDFENAFSPESVERAGWIITAYLIGYTIFMPVMGRVADVLGHRFLFNISIVIFVLGSVLCALSPSIEWLAFFRAIQAIGGGAIVPIAMGIVGFSFSRRQQALAIGMLVAAGEAGGVIGPLYGAYLAEFLGWRWIFWINIPLGLIVIGVVWWLVSRHPRQSVPIDYRGATLLALFLTVITVGLSGQKTIGWYEFTLPLLAAGVALLAAFIFVERRTAEPAVKLSIFRNVTFSAANIANVLEGVAMITALVQVPFFAYTTVAATPLEGGLLVIRMTVMIPIGAVIGGLLINRISHRYTAATGFALAATGLFLVSRWGLDVSSATQTRDLMIAGFGFGLNSPALAAAVVGSLERARLATGSAIHIVAKMTGMMVGLAALGGWGVYQFEERLNLEGLLLVDWEKLESFVAQRSVEAILQVLNRFFLVAAILCALAIIPSLMIRVQDEEDEKIHRDVV
ncbi:MAG: MFS transporter [Thermoleophilia bacterium]